MKMLLDAGLLHGDCLTVTGQTMAENLARRGSLPARAGRSFGRFDDSDQEGQPPRRSCTAISRPKAPWRRSPARKGCVSPARARVFDGEEQALQAILDGTIVKPGDVVVIRYEGPRGGPGMREMLSPTSAIMGKGLGDKVAL